MKPLPLPLPLPLRGGVAAPIAVTASVRRTVSPPTGGDPHAAWTPARADLELLARVDLSGEPDRLRGTLRARLGTDSSWSLEEAVEARLLELGERHGESLAWWELEVRPAGRPDAPPSLLLTVREDGLSRFASGLPERFGLGGGTYDRPEIEFRVDRAGS